MKDQKKVGLSLSGGGYRAAAYHIGTLRKLRKMDLLDKIDFISSNSGGSITAAVYCLNHDNWEEFERVMFKGLKRNMIARILLSFNFLAAFLLLVGITILAYYYLGGFLALVLLIVIIGFFQYALFPFSKRNEQSYRSFFVGKKVLNDLPKEPILVMNSTNVETGRPFIFATDQMVDTSYRYPVDGGSRITFKHKEFPISRAIAASTCVPFAFTPVRIKGKFFTNLKDISRVNPRLVDGGVYDNQGTHRLSYPKSRYASDIIIVSDAGNKMPFRNTYRNVFALLIRVSDVFMNRIKNIQMIDLLYDSIENKNREVAYQSLGWDSHKSIDKFIEALRDGHILDHVWQSHGITQAEIDKADWDGIESKLKKSIGYDDIMKDANTKEQTKLARSVGTNLTPLGSAKEEALINHASVMTEIQVRLYCPSL